MADNPDDASVEYSECHYDLAVWYPDQGEWVPKGYAADWEQIKFVYLERLRVSPLKTHVVLVERTTKHTDLTDQVREELSLS